MYLFSVTMLSAWALPFLFRKDTICDRLLETTISTLDKALDEGDEKAVVLLDAALYEFAYILNVRFPNNKMTRFDMWGFIKNRMCELQPCNKSARHKLCAIVRIVKVVQYKIVGPNELRVKQPHSVL